MLQFAKQLYLRVCVDGINPKQLWRRYLLGLTLIIALLLGTHLASTGIIASTDGDAVVINESGRQRMLSQRILYFATATASTNDAAARDSLSGALALFEAAHDELTTLEDLSAEARSLYFAADGGAALDAMVRAFVSDGRVIAAMESSQRERRDALDRMKAVGPGPLLFQLNRVVKQFEVEAKARSEAISRFQNIGLLLAAITILIEALLIFAPAQLAARRALLRLETQTWDLETANAALEALRSAAERDALHDPLTGLANRRYLEREMAHRTLVGRDKSGGVAVLHIDLDRFKQINDTLGHGAGDHILRHVANVLGETVDAADFIARVGGDEFVVLRSSQGEREPLEALAARIIERLSRPVDFEGDVCHFGASVGIDIGIAAEAGPNIDPQRLLANADIALYRSKELGRGRFTFFCDALREEIETSRRIADDLAAAIARREFFPVYQPQICAQTGALHGVEALARWRHPTDGVLTPDRFIPIAERLGLMAEIDRQILESGLNDLAKWDALGLTTPRLSVNVSGRRLRDPQLVDSLIGLDLPEDRLSFEIVETIFADRIDQELGENLATLRALGVQLEIDDFGTGHSSLASIIALRPARLKIARELIEPLPGSELHRSLAASILSISRTVGAAVVAEGVETAAQAALLRDLGCDVLQGFYFARPLSAEDFVAFSAQGDAWAFGPAAERSA